MNTKVTIHRLATGVPGLDQTLGGGLPEFSFNLIVGPPGTGKTTLAHQIMFALATRERPALFFTVLGESPLKMLRYQQQFSFFDPGKINESIRYVNLSDDIATGRFEQVLARIRHEVEAFSPALVFVDSFRSVMAESRHQPADSLSLHQFIHQLGVLLSGWQATTFLIGEYTTECNPHPVSTVADGLLSLEQSVYRNSMVRKMQVIKMRGQATLPGMHTFRITSAGLEIYPAAVVRIDAGEQAAASGISRRKVRLAMGVPRLDEMIGNGRLGLINTRFLDLSIDEIVQNLCNLIHQMKATQVVIDSLSGFELAVTPTFREDFRESLFRMVTILSGLGVTVLMTSELEDRYVDLRFSPYGSAFLTDAIIIQRYIEVDSTLKRVMAVVKVRASNPSNEIRQFDITDDGIVIGGPVLEYEGLLGGRPIRTAGFDTVVRGKS